MGIFVWALKCSVIVFKETRMLFIKSKKEMAFRTEHSQGKENYKYLGIMFNKYMSLKVNIKDAFYKLKGTFISLVNCGIVHEHGLHPLFCQKIYKCIVLPKALYGCETWYTVTESDILSLERVQRFCIKHMQGLNIRTRTDIALSIMAMYTIESDIDFRKLTALGHRCRLNIDHWLGIVFLNRMCSFDENNKKTERFYIRLSQHTWCLEFLRSISEGQYLSGSLACQIQLIRR